MSVRYVSRDLEWTEPKRECVRQKIIEPLQRFLGIDNFELSVHLEAERARPAGLEVWAVLQTFDGRKNEMICERGGEFSALIDKVSNGLRSRLESGKARSRFNINLGKFLPFEQTA